MTKYVVTSKCRNRRAFSAALALAGLMVAVACSAGPASGTSGRPFDPTPVSSETSGIATESSKGVATTAEPVPPSTTDRVEAKSTSSTQGSETTMVPADAAISPDDSLLPVSYFTDRGNDEDGQPAETSMRADLHDFALAARAAHRDLADELGWTLQTVPWAVCVLGPTLDRGWAGFVAAIDENVEATALAVAYASHPAADSSDELEPMSSSWTRPPTGINSPDLADLYVLAGDMFCGSTTPRGDPSEHLPGWEPAGAGPFLELADQVLPYWVHRQSFGQPDVGRTDALGATYAVVAALPTLADVTASDVRLFTAGGMCFETGYNNGALAASVIPPDALIHDDSYDPGPLLESWRVDNLLAIYAQYDAITYVGCPAERGNE